MLEIVTIPDPILRKKAKSITKFDDSLRRLIQEMLETLENNRRKGVGLAAPQVGRDDQLIIVKNGRGEKSSTYALINPEIASISVEKEDAYEGCLSIPDTFCLVSRYKKVVVKALNPKGEKITIKASDLFARVLQHEIDHLEGILITDKAIGQNLTEAAYDKLLDSTTD